MEPQRLEVGYPCEVTLDKGFGPLIMCDLRITIDYERCEWVVERQAIKRGKDGDEESWEVVARVHGQASIDVEDEA